MFFVAGAPRRLGVPDERAAVRFALVDRTPHLLVADKPAFQLSFWCGSCPFLFERLPDSTTTFSTVRDSLDLLEQGFDDIDESTVETFSALLPAGDYQPLLLEVRPWLVAPHDDGDYFTHEHVQTWGVDPFWGLPHNPRITYYRTFETRIDDDKHLYEFVVPLVPPSWNEPERVGHYVDLMESGATPVAVALSILDVCEPAMSPGPDHYQHWGFTHFLLDGHHKFEAAARTGRSIRLLALVGIGKGQSSPEQVARLSELRVRPQARRRPRLNES